MVKTIKFGDLDVPVPGFGAMGLNFGMGSNFTLEQAEPLLLKALELGCTFWDTAIVYNAGVNEKLLGDFLKKHNARDKVFLATKCGIQVDFGTGKSLNKVDNSRQHILSYIEGSLERLQSPPDLFYLHRIEPGRDLEESIGTLDELRKAGKTKYIGLSECSAKTLRKAHSIAKIDAVQAEYSAFETCHETDDLLDTARELGIAYIAYSPIGRGFLSGEIKSPDHFSETDVRKGMPRYQGENFYKNMEIVDEFQKLAQTRGCTPSQLAIAWVIAQEMIPIPGTTKVHRLEENMKAADIELTQAEMAEIRKFVDQAKPTGARYAPAAAAMIGH